MPVVEDKFADNATYHVAQNFGDGGALLEILANASQMERCRCDFESKKSSQAPFEEPSPTSLFDSSSRDGRPPSRLRSIEESGLCVRYTECLVVGGIPSATPGRG